MYKEIPIKLTPYLGRSKSLIEFFGIIGYDEKILSECLPNILKGEKDIQISLISNIISEYSDAIFDPKKIIKEIFPNKPNIIEIIKSNQQEPEKNLYYLYTFYDSINGKSKILYIAYILKFYEKYQLLNSSCYVPKAFVFYSQYPYFLSLLAIISSLLDETRNNNNIPLEAYINCLINYIPSPLNYKLNLSFFPNKKIIIPKMTGYPFIDFDLIKIINNISTNKLIRLFLFTFLEIPLLFFSANLMDLSIFIYLFKLLNFPLIDSQYYWYIKIFKENENKSKQDNLNQVFRGVNKYYNSHENYSDFKAHFIFNIDKGVIININKDINKDKHRRYKQINKIC